MVPTLRHWTWLVWVIFDAAQFLFACRPSMAAAAINIHHHPEGMSTLSPRRRVINSNLIFQGQQFQIITTEMQGLQGGTNSKENFLCRTLGRCLLVQELADSEPPYDSPSVPVADHMDPPVTLPTLPTDPESPPPPAPRTNPSSLLTPSPPSSTTPGGGSIMSKGSSMAGKVGISAGVGVSGILLLVVALLYYFKPDIFMCCKTCVRVQIFHHNHQTKK